MFYPHFLSSCLPYSELCFLCYFHYFYQIVISWCSICCGVFGLFALCSALYRDYFLVGPATILDKFDDMIIETKPTAMMTLAKFLSHVYENLDVPFEE